MIRLCILILEAHVNLKDFLINNLRKVFKEVRSARRLLLSQNYPQSQFVHLRKTDHRAQSVSRPAGQFVRRSSISAQEIRTRKLWRRSWGGVRGVFQCDAFTNSAEAALKPLLTLHQRIYQCLMKCEVETELFIHNTFLFFFNQLNVPMQLALEQGLLLGDFFFFPSCFGVKCGDTQSKTNQINFAC